MNILLKERVMSMNNAQISQSEIDSYRNLVIKCLKENGATNAEINLLHDATIRNSIRQKRKPEDVAWAILQ